MPEKPSISERVIAYLGGSTGCAAILSTILGIVIGFWCGLFYGESRGYHRQYLEERELIEPLLASDPALSDVKVLARSSGGLELIGTVPTQSDRDRLRDRIIRAVGEKRADEIVRPVMVSR